MDKEVKKVSKKQIAEKKKALAMEKESKLEIIEKIPCADLENKFVHIRVGTVDKPATPEQISEVQDMVEELFDKNDIKCLPLVTHHAVSIDIIEKRGI